MAVKRVQRRKAEVIEQMEEQPVVVTDKQRKMGKWGWVGLGFALLCVFWWRTNSWPVVAVVGMRPIFRSEVNNELFKQGGKSVVDSLVTERLVESELNKNSIRISDNEIDGKIAEIKTNFPSEVEFRSALGERGLSLADLRRQINLQMGIEKLLQDRVQISASETAKFIEEMGTVMTSSTAAEREIEAMNILKNQKLQQEISVWIEDLRARGKVWWIGKV